MKIITNSEEIEVILKNLIDNKLVIELDLNQNDGLNQNDVLSISLTREEVDLIIATASTTKGRMLLKMIGV